MKINVMWQTDSTGSFNLQLSDFEGCETEADVEKIIEEAIDDDFRINASGYCRHLSEHVAKIMESLKTEAAE